MLVYVRDGSAQTIVRDATLREQLQIKLLTQKKQEKEKTGKGERRCRPQTERPVMQTEKDSRDKHEQRQKH